MVGLHLKPSGGFGSSSLSITKSGRLLALLLLFFLAVQAGPTLAAANPARQKEDLRELRERIEALQRGLAAAEGSRTEAADALRDSERAISASNRTLRELADRQGAIGERLTELQGQSRRVGADIESQQARLARLLYRQYTGGQANALKLMLNREDPNQTARHLHYLTYLARARADLIQNLRGSLTRFDELSRTTSEEGAELAALHAEEQAQRQRLEQEKRARKEVLVKVSRDIDRQRREISTLRRDEARLARLVEQLNQLLARSRRPTPKSERMPEASRRGATPGELASRVNLPVRGEVRNRFGTPRADGGLTWKGLFIAAPSGEDVKAIAAGRVVFADWLRGFGNLLILDHGSGYMSLYGNNETLYKQVGEAIKNGETIAAVGSSGGNVDSGLYFEIRHQGKAVDPLGWINPK